MTNRILKGMAAGLAGALLVSLAAACGSGGEEGRAATYVGLDVNPSLSLVLDEEDKVLAVRADNEDAQVLLYGEELVGMSAADAAKKIAGLCVEMGYLGDENRGVNITVEGKADAEALSKDIEASFTASAKGLELRFTSEGTFSLNRRLNALKAEYASDAAIQGLTAGKFRLVAQARSVDRTLTAEAAADMEVPELLALLSQKAEETEPYATAAYNAARTAAARLYEASRGQLLDSVWMAPYLKPEYAADVLLGKRVHYGAIYNLYTGSARLLAAGIDAAEAAAALAEKTELSDGALEGVADALKLAAEEKAAFLAEMEKGGKTVAALDEYLDAYFRNMTADERAAARETMNEAMRRVQAEADKIDAAIADEYKAALEKLCADLTALVPASVKDTAGAYVTEFKALVADLRAAASGKEPLAAAHAALTAIRTRAEKVLEALKADLGEEDVKAVEETIAKLNDKLSALEKQFQEALAQAEREARDYLASLKAARTQAA